MPENKPQKLSLAALVAIAVGQVVGAGIITTTGLAIAQTGRSVWVAYALAVVMGFIWIIPVVFFASIARYRGGAYCMVTTLMGEKAGGIYAVWWIPMFISMAMIGTAIGSYFHSIFPDISVKVFGIVFATFFYIVNMFGVHMMAKIEKPMTWILLVCLMAFAIIGMTKLQPGSFNVTSEGYFMNGMDGFLGGLVLLVYSTSGHHMVQAMSWDAKDPKKNIPKAIMIATAVIFVLYVSVSFVAGNVLPVEQVAGQPLTFAARQIFPGALFAVFIICGPIMALVTTLNSGFSAVATPVLGAIRNGWLPSSLGKTNKYGAPVILYTAMWILGTVPMLMGVSLSALTNYTVITGRICGTMVCLAMFQIPTKYKDAWEKSWLHMPNGVFYAIAVFSAVTQIIAVIISAKNLGTRGFLINIIVVIILAAYALMRYAQGKVHSSVTCQIGIEEED